MHSKKKECYLPYNKALASCLQYELMKIQNVSTVLYLSLYWKELPSQYYHNMILHMTSC
jgi:hypothetical protein